MRTLLLVAACLGAGFVGGLVADGRPAHAKGDKARLGKVVCEGLTVVGPDGDEAVVIVAEKSYRGLCLNGLDKTSLFNVYSHDLEAGKGEVTLAVGGPGFKDDPATGYQFAVVGPRPGQPTVLQVAGPDGKTTHVQPADLELIPKPKAK